MKTITSLLALLGLVSLSLADEHAAEDLDYGDYKSATLQVKAWEALDEREYEDAVKYTEKCAELYEEKAREMQASLWTKPRPEVTWDYWALNDVGTCYFIRGEALTKLKEFEQAIAAYKVVRDELSYSQAWDPKGWFWSASDAAKEKINMLEARKKEDF